MKILPQHIPNGERFTENDLKSVNDKLEVQYKKEAFCWIGTLIGMFALGGIMSAIGGAVGYMLAVVCFIGAIPVSTIMARKPSKTTFKEVAKLGMDNETWKASLANLNEDKYAWGETVSKKIRYRFTCRKCKKVSSWFEHTFESCTDESLTEKLNDFKHQTMDKGYFYENRKRIGSVRYSLKRQCPSCGKIQPKCSPRWWTVPLTALVALVLNITYTLIMVSIRDALGMDIRHNPINDIFINIIGPIIMMFSLIAVIASIVRCIRLRKKAAPEYDLS